MPWAYILRLLGPGLLWGKSQEQLSRAIAQAHSDNRPEAAEHLQTLLKLRNRVMFEDTKPPQR